MNVTIRLTALIGILALVASMAVTWGMTLKSVSDCADAVDSLAESVDDLEVLFHNMELRFVELKTEVER